MNTHIRALLGGALAAMAGALAATPALAQQDYPNRAIRVIHGYPVGGGADILGRKFISKMQEASGKTFVMDNKPGNAGNIAVGLGATAKPDGYTLVIGSSSNMVGAKYFYKDVNFDPVKDFTPIGSFLEGSFVLVVSAQTPFNDLKGFTAWMKERQRAKFAYSNQLGQLAGEYLKARLGVSAEQVAYKSAPEAYPDVQSGLVDFMVADGTTSAKLVQNGNLKAIAMMTGQRHPAFAQTPTMRELGYDDADFSTWWALYTPAGVDPAIRAKLEGWLKQAANDPEVAEFYHSTGNMVLFDQPDAVRARIEREIARWAPLVKAAGITPQ